LRCGEESGEECHRRRAARWQHLPVITFIFLNSSLFRRRAV